MTKIDNLSNLIKARLDKVGSFYRFLFSLPFVGAFGQVFSYGMTNGVFVCYTCLSYPLLNAS